MISKEAKWNIRCFPIWRVIISGCFLRGAWFVLLNVLKRSLSLAWIYEMHNAVLNLCHSLKMYMQQIIFYCLLERSCIVVIRFCTWMWKPIWLLRTSPVVYLKLDGSRSYEKQGVAVPDVDVHRVEGQVTQEPALLPRPQETLVYSELQLQAWRGWAENERGINCKE